MNILVSSSADCYEPQLGILFCKNENAGVSTVTCGVRKLASAFLWHSTVGQLARHEDSLDAILKSSSCQLHRTSKLPCCMTEETSETQRPAALHRAPCVQRTRCGQPISPVGA